MNVHHRALERTPGHRARPSAPAGRIARAGSVLLFAALCLLPGRVESYLDADEDDLIHFQIRQDMMYGTDDYFGENTDLSYADRAVSSAAAPAGVPSVTDSSTRSQPRGDAGSSRSGRSADSSSRRTGGASEVQPPEQAPDDEPPVPEDPPPI